jgi:hypothetical protein
LYIIGGYKRVVLLEESFIIWEIFLQEKKAAQQQNVKVGVTRSKIRVLLNKHFHREKLKILAKNDIFSQQYKMENLIVLIFPLNHFKKHVELTTFYWIIVSLNVLCYVLVCGILMR